MTRVINMIFIPILYILSSVKEVLNTRVVNFGTIYLLLLKP